MNQDFQSEPEIILIRDEQADGENENFSGNETENDENNLPSNENEATEADDEVQKVTLPKLLLTHCQRQQDVRFV